MHSVVSAGTGATKEPCCNLAAASYTVLHLGHLALQFARSVAVVLRIRRSEGH